MRDLVLSDRDRRLLEACLRDDRHAVETAFEAWRPYANPDRMRGRDLRVMPALTANLRRMRIDDPSVAWLRGQAKHVWLTGALRLSAFERALDVMATSAIPFILLKGAALLVRWRREADQRPMGDFDVLVPFERVREALAALHGAGLGGPVPATVSNHDLSRFHALGFVDKAGNSTDLHWRPAEAIDDPDFGTGFSARSVEGMLGERRVRIPILTDHLVLLLAHAFNDTAVKRLDWLVEVDLLLRCASETDWDWPLFATLCDRYGLTDWACHALALVADVAGRPLPPGAIRSTADHEEPVESRSARRTRPTADPSRASRLSFPDGPSFSVGYDEVARFGPDGFDLGHHPSGASLLSGWSLPEVHGRWTDGHAAFLALRVPGGRVGDACLLRWDVLAYGPAVAQGLEAEVWAGAEPVRWRFDEGLLASTARIAEGRLQGCDAEAILLVSLRLKGLLASAPAADLGLDPRELGLFVKRIDILSERMLPVLQERLAFNTEISDRSAWTGWGEREPFGRWTTGAEAQIKIRLPREPRRAMRGIRIAIDRVFSRDGSAQRIDVVLNGTVVLTKSLPDGDASRSPGALPGGYLDIDLPDDLTRAGRAIDLRLRVADPTSPLAIGLSIDARALGVAVTYLQALY